MPPTPVFTASGNPTIITANDDGSLNVRVARGRGDNEGDWIKLPEPNALQFSELIDIANRVDAAMPDLDPVLHDTPEERLRFGTQWRERRKVQYSKDSPAALGFIDVVELLTQRRLEMSDLHIGAMRPLTIGAMIRGWEAPLDGGDSLPLLSPSPADAPDGNLSPAPETDAPPAASPAVAPGSPASTDPANRSPLPSSTP